MCDIEYVTLSCMFLAKYALDGDEGERVFCVRFVITLIELCQHVYRMWISF